MLEGKVTVEIDEISPEDLPSDMSPDEVEEGGTVPPNGPGEC